MTLTAWMIAGAWFQMCAVWALLLWAQRRAVMLEPDGSETCKSPPSVAVVIPACNESAMIADCLRSVTMQTGVSLQVIVSDDRSEDDTAVVVAGLAEGDSRIRLLRITQLADGWLGKSHAMWTATRGLDADWLLFLDADCRLLHPTAILTACSWADRQRADLLTLWPRQAAGGFAEALLIPLCAAVMALWFGRSNQPSAAAFGNGQFLMMRRGAYEAVGGHRAVRQALIEDVPFAQHVRAAGYRTLAAGGRDLVAVRMYSSLRGVVLGWSRIFIGALRCPSKLVLSMLWLAAGSLWPMVMAVYLAVAWSRQVGAAPPESPAPPELVVMSVLCLLHLALLGAVSRGFWAMGRCDRRYLWLYPVSVLGVLGILAHAWWNLAVRRSVRWRTTRYRFDRRACIVGEG